MVVVPRRRRLPGLDLLISRWRLLPQLRLILPVAVRPKRFFAPLFVFSLGISNPWFKVAAARHARGRPWLLNRGGAACRRLKARVIAAPPRECKAARPYSVSAAACFFGFSGVRPKWDFDPDWSRGFGKFNLKTRHHRQPRRLPKPRPGS